MIKLMIFGRRAPGRSRAAAQAHLRDVHGRMVVSPPADAGPMPVDYVQNHVFDGAYPSSGPHGIERDLVTELWFNSIDNLRASTATPYYLENLKPDEPRFVDDASVAKMIVRATPLLEGKPGLFKAFVALTGGTAEAAVARALEAPGLLSAVRNDVMPSATGGPLFVDMVIELWFAAAGSARAMTDHLADFVGADGADPSASFAVAAEQYDTARLRTLPA